MSRLTAEQVSRSCADTLSREQGEVMQDSVTDKYRDLRRPRKLRFYVNGDRYFRGKKIYVIPNRYYNLSDLLDDLTSKLPSSLNLPYGVRQIFTPVRGHRIQDIEDLVEGQNYVCAGFEAFKTIKYGRSELEPWSVAHSQMNPMAEQEPENSIQLRYHGSNNAFHPGRYIRTNQSYPQRRAPDRNMSNQRGRFGASVGDHMERPKVITIIRSGTKPRRSIKILLNRRMIQSYEQLIADISEAFGVNSKSKTVRKLFTVRGKEVQGISDFFRGDNYFVAFGTGDLNVSETDIADILGEAFPDPSVAKTLLLKWKKNERRRRKLSPSNQIRKSNKTGHVVTQVNQLNPSQVTDKRDSGFDSADASTNRSEPEQIDRLGVLRPQKMVGMEKGKINGHDVDNETDNKSDVLTITHSQEHYLLKRIETDRLTVANEENERLKWRRRNTNETDKRAVNDENKRRVLVSVQNYDNHLSQAGHSRVKGIEADMLNKNGAIKEEQRIKVETLQKDREDNDSSDIKASAADAAREETGEQEKIECEEMRLEKKSEDEKMMNSQEKQVHLKGEHSARRASHVTETDTRAAYVPKHDENKEQTILVSIETITAGNVLTADITDSLATGFVSGRVERVEAKDKNNNQQLKEKRKQDREYLQQRKRVKTKIVRKTKLERQVSSDDYVLSRYEFGRKLGDGNFAIVRQSLKKETGQEFAIKIIDKAKLKGKAHMVENEIDILKDCCHHNIVRLYEEYETMDRIYLVMELVKGGDLFDAITQNVKFREADSALMIKDLCNALFYMHSRSIVHRDLKPENVLVHRSKDGSITLKLADLGLAMEVKEPIYTVCGTPTYVAPEILTDIGYGLEVDMWAVGVITYILLCGFPPFRSPDRNQTELFELIKAGYFEFLSPYWDNITRNAKDLISRLLVVDRKKRYTSVDVLCHKWVLCGGHLDVVPEGAVTVDAASKQFRRELDGQAKLNYESYQRLKEKKTQEQKRREQ